MNYGEKYLHHYFATDRIGGEWFDLDNQQVMADVAPILQTLSPKWPSGLQIFEPGRA